MSAAATTPTTPRRAVSPAPTTTTAKTALGMTSHRASSRRLHRHVPPSARADGRGRGGAPSSWGSHRHTAAAAAPPAVLAAHHAPLADGEGTVLARDVPPVLDVIDRLIDDGHTVAVYCQQGKSRSASVVVMHLMRRHNLSSAAARALLKERYRRMELCIPFINQLDQIQQL